MSRTSIYSYGEDSPLKFEIPDKLAERYNEAVEEFLKAQRRFTQKFGRAWDPATEPIKIKWSKKHRKAWGEFSKVFNEAVERSGPYHANDIMDDFLVKNIGSAAAVGSENWGRLVAMSVGTGALYGFLRRP